jgi:hypothetical protein
MMAILFTDATFVLPFSPFILSRTFEPACPASVDMDNPLGDPMAPLRVLHEPFSVITSFRIKMPKQTGYIQLCPSTVVA